MRPVFNAKGLTDPRELTRKLLKAYNSRELIVVLEPFNAKSLEL